MGTRGLIGFRLDGIDKLTYNHFDSYPAGLGRDIVINQLPALLKMPDLLKRVADIRLVHSNGQPTAQQIRRLRRFANLQVGTQSVDDWYCLLREMQGKLTACVEAGVMIDSHEFIRDSLFCEWAYIVNLDANVFEVYRGFQKEKHTKGRYVPCRKPLHADSGTVYYPCALAGEFPLDGVTVDQVLALDFDAEDEGCQVPAALLNEDEEV